MTSRHAAVVALGLTVGLLDPSVGGAQVRAPAHVERPSTGTPPTNVAAEARDAFAVTVSWELAPGAQTHAVDRASSPAGPWRRVGVYAPPAPATRHPSPSGS